MDGLRPLWQRVARALFRWSRMNSADSVARQPALSPNKNTKDDTGGTAVDAHKSVPSPSGLGPWEVDVDEMVGGAS